jgi:hypothetical protein
MSASLGLRDRKVLVLLVREEQIETQGREVICVRRGGMGAARRIPGVWAGKLRITIYRVEMLTTASPRAWLISMRKGAG